MALLLPGAQPRYPEFDELADRVTNGDGTGWGGDPRLWLGVGLAENRTAGIILHRLEVWRSCEDGTEQLIGSWHVDEAYRIPRDLAEMRLDAPGRQDAIDRIDRHNAGVERAARDAYNDKMGTALDHLARFMADTTGPRTRFYMGGRDGARA